MINIDTEGWREFEREYPLAASQVRMDIEHLVNRLRAIERHTSGVEKMEGDEPSIIDYLSRL